MRRLVATAFALFAISSPFGSDAHARHYEHKEHHLGPTGLFGVTSPTNIKITKARFEEAKRAGQKD